MSASMKKADEIELARRFLDHAYALVEWGEDTIYALLDPECKYGNELMRRLNNYTIRELLSLGFKEKYGVDWHSPEEERRSKWCANCATDCQERQTGQRPDEGDGQVNRAEYESLPDAELVRRIRVAMGEGCIRPVHVYDMVDVLLARVEEPAGDGAAMREAQPGEALA